MSVNESATVPAENDAINILVYSDNREVRADVMNAVGNRLGKDLPAINWTESATWQAAEMKIQEGNFSLLILDAETPKLGGIGLGKKVRDEIDPDMDYIVLIARPQDEWLARVSKPNAIVPYPIDPRELSTVVARVLREKAVR
ncbi:two-component system response regulator [Arcanobacterium bovis]|uniref:Two-component system response regulator n=1 Tax=Arcanobacterium bovis TaxID=2529275 RepID=A0A4Q9V166_9ACTO|nr:two-component system response regulator [Arcanobacterium bovis]TBW22834.1 two-component system response regulator [Arcanobacterium bovis]